MKRITDRADIKNPSIVTLVVFSVAIFVIVSFIIATSSPAFSSDEEVADGFYIQSYDVLLDVKENNKVDVTETLTVNWTDSNYHGLYRFVPTWLEYTGKDGKTIKRKSNIYDLRSSSDKYEVEIVNKKEKIRLGDENKYVEKGEHTYVIEYTYDMGGDPYKGFDAFIFHAYGDYWNTRIKNATLKVIMPESIDKDYVRFFADKYRENDITKNVTYDVKDNVLTASVNDDYDLIRSLTIDISLKEGYFKNSSSNYGIKSLIICIFIIVITIVLFILWLIFGKDYDNEPQTIEFYSPEDLDPSEIGYIYGKQTSRKLTVSLIVSLAAKGYIKINDSNGSVEISETRQLNNLKDIPDLRTIVVKKGKEPDNTLNDVESLWMNHLFNKSNEKEIVSGFDEFYDKCNSLIEKGYVKVISDSSSPSETIEKVADDVKLPPLTINEKIVYDNLFKVSSPVVLNTDPTFYKTFDEVSKSLIDNHYNELDEKKSDNIKLASLITTFFMFVAWIVAYTFFEDLNPLYSWLYYVSLSCIPISCLLSIIMDRKTKYGEIMEARILGFKNYLETAEKYEIEQRVEQDPEYYYKTLAYAYVLNVSKKWISKFENIQMPTRDIGTFDYISTSSFDNIGSSIYYPSSSSDGSSGGCSSCGGGCSSCGGGGSW